MARWHGSVCLHCGEVFRHLVATGRIPRFCSDECRSARQRSGLPDSATCPTCSTDFRPGRPGGVVQVYCSRRCNPRYVKPCTQCGRLGDTGGYVRKSSKPYTCHQCRRVERNSKPSLACLQCGGPLTAAHQRKYCGITCSNRATNTRRMIRPPGSRHSRNQREAIAPGLSYRERRDLSAKWKRQGRRCSYCPAAADTLDHVVPLVRGGTNWEGNLAPACRSCNGSKAGWMLVEWRSGKRLAAMSEDIRWKRTPKPKRKAMKPAVQVEMKVCPVCSALHSRLIYCSVRCCQVANEKRKTDRVRKPPRTACPSGHPYTDENRRVRIRMRDGVARTETECRRCNKVRGR